MLIGAYGMFWYRDEVDFDLQAGSTWDLLGRRGTNRPGLQVADFRRARGVYVLFDDYGAYYVGLARGQGGIGGRLRDHTQDQHSANWSRFCWFSFDSVSQERDESGRNLVSAREDPVPNDADNVIRELEALLITIMNTRNVNKMKFQQAEQWHQIHWYQRDLYSTRIVPS